MLRIFLTPLLLLLRPNMPRGPKGEKRPGDVIGAAMVGSIATRRMTGPATPRGRG